MEEEEEEEEEQDEKDFVKFLASEEKNLIGGLVRWNH